jgi:hypothetical protein
LLAKRLNVKDAKKLGWGEKLVELEGGEQGVL